MSKLIDLSIVIATLGSDSLHSTIESINNSSFIPNEILICLPNTHISKLIINNKYNNINIVITKVKGQVQQRLEGFNLAKNDLIMQLDDDIILDKNCLEILFNSCTEFKQKVALSCTFYYHQTNSSIYKRNNKNKILNYLYYFTLNNFTGFKEGIITQAGTEIGVDPQNITNSYISVDWLLGGLILHNKNNIVNYNYFPLSGKAYCEDLIHSRILTNNGIELYIVKEAKAWIDKFDLYNINFLDFLKVQKDDYRARKYFIKNFGGNTINLHLYYLIKIIIFQLKKIF